MAEPTLDLLQRMVQQVLDEMRIARATQGEHTIRLGRIEREVVGTRREILNLHEDFVGLGQRLDNLGDRLTRLETRTGLIDAEAS